MLGRRRAAAAARPPLDPYIQELGPGPGERQAFCAMHWAWLVLLVLVAAVIWATLR